MKKHTDSESIRCPWCGSDLLYVAYHDTHWGKPCQDETTMFEFLVLESAQSGLSWITILRKREGYRRAFSGFDSSVIATYTDTDRARLLSDPGIVRNKAKIEATIANARAALALHEAGRSLSSVVWSRSGGHPLVNRFEIMDQVPAKTADSEDLAFELRSLGFKHVGPVVAYSLMQAMGVVNDHLLCCMSHPEHAKVAPKLV